jgi:ribonucleotide monophosphatase NagD (HAD superfamily)
MDSDTERPLPRTSGNTVAFAFDIGGVLLDGTKPIPGARQTLMRLQEGGIPFIFLTNSTGATEKVNLEDLSLRLGNIAFDKTQIVQSRIPFREALIGLWNHTANGAAKPEYTMSGKPTHTTYRCGECGLQDLIAANPQLDAEDIKTVYMVWGSPEFDITDANTYQSQCGYRWRSVLVETGAYRSGATLSHMPYHTARNVQEAVEWALEDAEEADELPARREPTNRWKRSFQYIRRHIREKKKK